MNNGNVCVSVHARHAGDLISLLRKAERLADVIELRLDGLQPADLSTVLKELNSEKQLLITMRPRMEGGRSEMSLPERVAFWSEVICRIADRRNVWIDHEHDLLPLAETIPHLNEHLVIRSRHFFEPGEHDLRSAYNTVASDREVVKIAVTTEDATDAIGVWKLLEQASRDNRRLVPIAMGEAGKWTRVLGPAYGAFMTYSALETGNETAAGQVAVRDLTETFRVRELDRETKVFGIIAGNTSYSVSPWMHNAAFRAAGLNAVFLPLQTAEVEKLLTRMVLPNSREVDLNFGGFSVTNPHKEAIIPLLDAVDPTATKIGAVNTVKIDEHGKLFGFNTDAFGFISTLKRSYAGELSEARVAVLGSGGAARACVHALTEEDAAVTILARNEAKGGTLAEEFGAKYAAFGTGRALGDDFDIVVNTTPIGTAGTGVGHSPLAGADLGGLKLVYDLVYNPAATKLILDAKAAGVPAINGMDMLIAQGARQFEIWTGLEAPDAEMRAAVERQLGA